ncbi:hypothetical protein ACLOAU_00200 [Niabella sp. CJ426]|uniref:hypothetical protein n=1 Tax=Niabella sp. CJ426 TaxID=3393740 RepID=UPI003D083D52
MNIKILLSITLFLTATCMVSAQAKTFKINAQSFITQSKKIGNEWNTQDEIRELYILKKGKQQYVLAYYPYKDEGGDCNNLFWTKEWLTVKTNTIIITTRHFQKTGRDPITEWERKTFTVSRNGEVELTEQLYKKYGSKEWTTEER